MEDVESPGGYEPYRHYPLSGASADLVALALAVALWGVMNVESRFAELSATAVAGVLAGTAPVLVAHETCHYVVGRALSLDPTVHWGLPTPYAVPLRQHVRRGQNLAVLLAPTVVVSGGALAVGALATGPFVVALCAFVVLVNTACAAGDLLGAAWLAVQPAGTLVYLDAASDGTRELYAHPESPRR